MTRDSPVVWPERTVVVLTQEWVRISVSGSEDDVFDTTNDASIGEVYLSFGDGR